MKQHLKIALQKASIRGLIVLFPILGNFLFLPNAKADLNSNITVKVDELKNQDGQICATLFDKSQGFPSDSKQALQSQCVKITERPQKLTFKDLKPGTYAVALFHDANGDGIFNSNYIGIPKEGFGFSRNPLVVTRPPKFEDAAVFVAGPNTDIDIKLQYLFGG